MIRPLLDHSKSLAVFWVYVDDLTWSIDHVRGGRVVVARWSHLGVPCVLSAPALTPLHDEEAKEKIASAAMNGIRLRTWSAAAEAARHDG